MIEQVDRRLKDWVASILRDVEVSFAAPGAQKPPKCANLFLYELVPDPPARTGTPAPLQFSVRYVVTAWAEQPEEAHRMLGQLVFAAMDSRDFQLELQPLPAEVWSAMGVPPRPSFVIRAPVRMERPAPKTKRVRVPLVIRTAPVTDFYGVVLGPGEFPIANARVEFTTLGLATETDASGKFRFGGAPGNGTVKAFRIKAKGQQQSISTTDNYSEADKPLVIHFTLPEE